MTFADAQTYCESLGKKLPVPSSADRIEEFKNEIFRTGIDFYTAIDICGPKSPIFLTPSISDTAGPVWLGATDQEIEGTFKNVHTGEIVHPLEPKLIPFSGHEPNDHGGNEVSPCFK